MIKWLTDLLGQRARADNLEWALNQALEENAALKAQLANPTAKELVNKIMDRPIEWVDWRNADEETRVYWGKEARAALDNKALQALIGKVGASPTSGELVKSCTEAIARRAQDFGQVQDMRMTMNGIELIREKLEEMLFEEPQPSKDGILDPI